MKHVFLRMAAVSCLFLVGCASSQAQIDVLTKDASGTISNVKNNVNAIVRPAVDAVNKIDTKVKKVQSGADLIRKGIGQIKEGI